MLVQNSANVCTRAIWANHSFRNPVRQLFYHRLCGFKATQIIWAGGTVLGTAGISIQVFNSITDERAQRTSEMSSWTLEEKFHIYKQQFIILYLTFIWILVLF